MCVCNHSEHLAMTKIELSLFHYPALHCGNHTFIHTWKMLEGLLYPRLHCHACWQPASPLGGAEVVAFSQSINTLLSDYCKVNKLLLLSCICCSFHFYHWRIERKFSKKTLAIWLCWNNCTIQICSVQYFFFGVGGRWDPSYVKTKRERGSTVWKLTKNWWVLHFFFPTTAKKFAVENLVNSIYVHKPTYT